MRILVAPDKFKGTLDARGAAVAIARGIAAALPEAEIECLPLADGGDGTAAALGDLPNGTVVVEVASTSGLVVQPDALRATSFRTGEALLALYARRPERILVGVGGSSSTDAGTGIARAAGWRFLDRAGDELPPGGAALRALHRIDPADARRSPCPVVALCDVRNVLLGPRGAARTFASQKGASPDDVEILEKGLARWAKVVRDQLGIDVAELPGSGAGGGIGAGLAAFFGADLVDGASFVADHVGLPAAIERADIVVSGEGRLDEGSRNGKVATVVADLARAADRPVYAVCGEVALSPQDMKSLGFAGWRDVISVVGRDAAVGTPDESLEAAAQALASAWSG